MNFFRRLCTTKILTLVSVFILAFWFQSRMVRPIVADEFFFLRAGVIGWQYPDVRPQHMTLFTLISGRLMNIFSDDYWLFLSYRFFTFAFFIATLKKVLKEMFGQNESLAMAIFLILVLLNENQWEYFLQFKYDYFTYLFGFILVAFVSEKEKINSWSASFYFCSLLASGPKGVLFSIPYLVSVVIQFVRLKFSVKDLKAFFFKNILILTSIFLIFLIFNKENLFYITYIRQLSILSTLGVSVSQRNFAVANELKNNICFWITIAICILSIRKISNISISISNSRCIYLLSIMATSIFYFAIHPGPTPQMLTEVWLSGNLFITYILIENWQTLKKSFVTPALGLVVFSISFWVWSDLPLTKEWKLDGRNLEENARLSRLMRSRISSAELVFDPTSILFFTKPCTTEWYLDGVYEDLRKSGHWMKDLDLSKCDYITANGLFFYLDPSYYKSVIDGFEPDVSFIFKRRPRN